MKPAYGIGVVVWYKAYHYGEADASIEALARRNMCCLPCMKKGHYNDVHLRGSMGKRIEVLAKATFT